MDNSSPKYPSLVITTVGKMLDKMEDGWKPYLQVSTPNDQANFMMHVAGSFIATVANTIAIATNGELSTVQVINELFSSINLTVERHNQNPSQETH